MTFGSGSQSKVGHEDGALMIWILYLQEKATANPLSTMTMWGYKEKEIYQIMMQDMTSV
jgi:hypothetical protein